jgi:hypothetical protein
MDRPTCCICLEDSFEETIHLIGCGCKVAWFHVSCENKWLSSCEYPYSCPTCRRPVPMITNYCFSYTAGPDQKFLQIILASIGVETCIAFIHPDAWALPLQSLAMLATPWLLYSERPLPFFLMCVYAKMFCQQLFMNLMMFGISYESSIKVVQNIGLLNIFVLYLSHYVSYMHKTDEFQYVDPLSPYAISRDVMHMVTLIPKAF